jgi:hypothetical protein
MKTYMNVVIISMMILATVPALASAATVSVGDATTVGSTVTVPINVAGAPDIGAMTITLTYDSSLLSATGVSKGTITSDALLIIEGTIDSSGGISDADNETMLNYGAIIGDITDNRVNISMISTDGFSGDGVIATITFGVVGSGTTSLTLTEVLANKTATCDPCDNETVVDPASYPEISITKEDGSYTAEATYDSADIDSNGAISPMELMAQISKWKLGEVEPMELMTSIGRWKLGDAGYL